MDEQFSQIDFGPLKQFLDNDDITDISYDNGGQVWLKSLSQGVFRVENTGIDNALMEKIAFQCANSMGKSFNMANPFLDAESAELRMNFVHDSIAKNGIAVLIRKTPAKIRLQKDKIIAEDYIRLNIHDFLLKCVEGHCNIMVSGETGSGKTEFIKYLAAHTKENEKIITIEDTLELHLDKIFPHRDIIAMKTNNIASYSDVLVTCMRQNPRWILLSEVRSAEAVMAVRNSISSGHNILSTIHADKAEYKILYKKTPDGKETTANPSKYLISYLESQGVIMPQDILVKEEFTSLENNDIINKDKVGEFIVDNSLYTESQSTSYNPVPSTVNTQNQSITPNQVSGTVPNTNIVEAPNNNIPNIYATASSAPSSINLTNINNNQNIS